MKIRILLMSSLVLFGCNNKTDKTSLEDQENKAEIKESVVQDEQITKEDKSQSWTDKKVGDLFQS